MRDVPINQEIRSYKENIIGGMFDMKQTICLIICAAIGLASYFLIPDEFVIIRYIVIIVGVAIPGIVGFFTYNNMSGEQFLLAVLRFYFIVPKRFTSNAKHEFYGFLEQGIKDRLFSEISTKEDNLNAEDTSKHTEAGQA